MGIVNQMDFLAQSAEHSLVEEGTDVSGYIVNASFTDKGEGWDITIPEDKIHFEQDLVWLDDSQGDISQTLLGMPNGVYELSVQALNRNDWNFENLDSLWYIGKQDSLRECVRTYLFLNDSQKRVKHAFDDGFNEDFLPENVNTEGWSDWDIRNGVKTNVMMPNTSTGARKYFDKGYYVNTIQAFVIDGTLTFGIHHEGGNWACVDSFSIKYVGKDLDLALELLQERLDSVEKYLDKQMIGTIKTRITESYNTGSKWSTHWLPPPMARKRASKRSNSSSMPTKWQPLTWPTKVWPKRKADKTCRPHTTPTLPATRTSLTTSPPKKLTKWWPTTRNWPWPPRLKQASKQART